MALFSLAFLLEVGLVLLVLRYYKAVLHFFRTYLRNKKHGEEIFGMPTLPIIGNVHQLPFNPQAWGDFIIEQSNRTASADESMFRMFVLHDLVVVPVSGKGLRPIIDSNVELNKGPEYHFYRQWLGDASLLVGDLTHWRDQRKLLTPVFHMSRLRGYGDAFNRHARTLVVNLEREGGGSGKVVVDIHHMLSHCSLDLVGEAMGLPLESQTGQMVTLIIGAVMDFNTYAYEIFAKPIYWIPWIWKWFGYARQTDAAVAVLSSTSRRAIDQAMKAEMANGKTTTDQRGKNGEKSDEKYNAKNFIELMLCAMRSGNEENGVTKLSLEVLQAQVDTFMFAGHDTAAQTLSWTLWCLATHPEIQERVHQEVVDVCGDAFSEEAVKEEHFPHLKYLERCVKEAMRYFPPVPILERMLHNDFEMGGKLLPAGTKIYISPYAVHHNEQIYPHHERYAPDRFLEEVSAQRHPYDYIPFSAGPRNCIGQKFAWMEMRIILVHILRRFRLASDVPFEANRPRLETVLTPSLGIPVRVYDRRRIQ